jgi:hypothetical protein
MAAVFWIRPFNTEELAVDLFGRRAIGQPHRHLSYLIPQLTPAEGTALRRVYCSPRGRAAALDQLRDWDRVLLGRAHRRLRELQGPPVRPL